MQVTFDQLPYVVTQLYEKLNRIERLLEAQPTQAIPAETDRWFSLDELCDYLPGKPAKATIYGRVHSRSIPHKKVGKRLAFLKSEIDQWLQSQARKTSAETAAEAEALLQTRRKRG